MAAVSQASSAFSPVSSSPGGRKGGGLTGISRGQEVFFPEWLSSPVSRMWSLRLLTFAKCQEAGFVLGQVPDINEDLEAEGVGSL